MSDREIKSFFRTLPGILGGLAALITAAATLYGVLREPSPQENTAVSQQREAPVPQPSVPRTLQSTPSPQRAAKAAASLTKSRIAFVSDRSGNNDIFLMDPDGANVSRLTATPDNEMVPSWAPSGRQIAYIRVSDQQTTLWVMSADGSNPRQLADSARAYRPAWSPDSHRLAFVSDRDGNLEIYTVAATGGTPERLTRDPSDDYAPSWSPDGGWIAFVSTRQGGSSLYLMRLDGSSLVRLTHTASDTEPYWSPDGRAIAFVSFKDDDFSLNIINPNGTDLRRVTGISRVPAHPAWSPDGARIVIDYPAPPRRGGIQVVNIDGSSLTRLTVGPSNDRMPHWSPALD
jgi:TolB protein